jgi:hypothetical protein
MFALRDYTMPVRCAIIFITSSLLLSFCSTEEPISTSGYAISSLPRSGVVIETLSTKPWLITGGDVLLQITVEPGVDFDSLEVELNGEAVESLFRGRKFS